MHVVDLMSIALTCSYLLLPKFGNDIRRHKMWYTIIKRLAEFHVFTCRWEAPYDIFKGTHLKSHRLEKV